VSPKFGTELVFKIIEDLGTRKVGGWDFRLARIELPNGHRQFVSFSEAEFARLKKRNMSMKAAVCNPVFGDRSQGDFFVYALGATIPESVPMLEPHPEHLDLSSEHKYASGRVGASDLELASSKYEYITNPSADSHPLIPDFYKRPNELSMIIALCASRLGCKPEQYADDAVDHLALFFRTPSSQAETSNGSLRLSPALDRFIFLQVSAGHPRPSDAEPDRPSVLRRAMAGLVTLLKKAI
jgi:hypothetical protein